MPILRLLIPTPAMAEKPKKPQKLKARLPRGLDDRGPAAINATRADDRDDPRGL